MLLVPEYRHESEIFVSHDEGVDEFLLRRQERVAQSQYGAGNELSLLKSIAEKFSILLKELLVEL